MSLDCFDGVSPSRCYSMLSDLPEWACLYAHVGLIIERLEDREIGCKSDNAPLPRGVITCGEAWTLFPLLFVLLAQKYPELSDPDQLSELLAPARTASASGLPN